MELCSSINGSAVDSEGRDAILTCLRKVKFIQNKTEFFSLLLQHIREAEEKWAIPKLKMQNGLFD